MIQKIENKDKFEDIIENDHLSIIHFSADWVEQCKQIDELLEALAKQNATSTTKFLKCDAEQLSDVSLKYKIEAVPTVILFKSGKELERVDGVNPGKLTTSIKKYAEIEAIEAKTLEERLKSLINKHKIMLFMKGNPTTPRCGFSRQIIEILRNVGEDFDTFDILEDEEVRQGLKTFSDWPTYPQLYVKGELIGGLDIVKELVASGELSDTLKG
ncbi:glutaredoxin 3 [Onthophagus taurus]|uniref:glutaredoxin 3 n=1 Tax=Onthophagus taurus TaxID=166361 RepID=UPI000C20D7A3|nr:glutaredoxin 3 [Onthophagus taurus]